MIFSFFPNRNLNMSTIVVSFVLFITLILELVVVERKFGIFGGGFLQSHVLDSPFELTLFFTILVGTYVFVLSCLFWFFVNFLGRKLNDTFAHYNYVFIVLATFACVLFAKYEILRYFSDAISFNLMKKLGGGSLIDALLFILQEAGLVLWVMGGCVGLYFLGAWVLYKVQKKSLVISMPKSFQRPGWGYFLLLAGCLLPCMFLLVKDVTNVNYALNQFVLKSMMTEVFSNLTDFDGDGYSFFSSPADAHPFDGSRHPLGLDIPNNGIDEDEIGGDFILVENPEGNSVPVIQGKKKHLVLIVLESTRGDVINKRYNGKIISPHLNQLAEQGTWVQQAYSHSGYTGSSLKTLFSGSLEAARKGQSLFRSLKANGYKVAVFSGQSEKFGEISESVGMKESSDLFFDAEVLIEERAFSFTSKGSLLIDGQVLLREFDKSLGTPQGWNEPTFVYFNFQSAHFPYYHSGMSFMWPGEPIPRGEMSAKNKDWVARTYWNAVSYGDWLTGQVIARLKTLGIYEDSLILVTADHGEDLFDDKFLGHGHVLNRAQTQIPLIINVPNLKISEPIGLTNYYSMIMNLLGANGSGKTKKIVDRHEFVFQYIGDLERPNSIGLVESNEKRTVLNLESGEIYYSDLQLVKHYQELPNGSSLEKRADKLIFEWERQRWIQHVNQSAKIGHQISS